MAIKTNNEQALQKRLKRFVSSRHPLYEAMAAHWQFLDSTYEGGRGWFASNVFRYIKEGDKEFAARLERAFRFNHTREVVDLVDKYLFKMEIKRSPDNSSEAVKRFWKAATMNGSPIQEFMKRVSNRGSVFGRIWIVVDMTRAPGVIRTKADQRKANVRPYAYILTPLEVLDLAYGDDGMLEWALNFETRRDDKSPLYSSKAVKSRFRLWTRTETRVWELRGKGSNSTLVELEDERVEHNLGAVPMIPHDNVISDDPYVSPSLIADVAYLDRACANYMSNLDAIIQDQTFSQLTIPADAVDGDANEKLVQMGTKRIFTYKGDSTGRPEYISPDVKQAEIILKVVSKIINEIYHSVGLAGERTKEDNSQGIDNSSGVAKAYDFERVNSLLASKADSLELTERRIARLVDAWAGEGAADDELPENLIHYPETFDVRGLHDEFSIAAQLQTIDAPEEVRREQMKSLIAKLFPQLKAEVLKEMDTALKNWPPKLVVTPPGEGGGGASEVLKNAASKPAQQKPEK